MGPPSRVRVRAHPPVHIESAAATRSRSSRAADACWQSPNESIEERVHTALCFLHPSRVVGQACVLEVLQRASNERLQLRRQNPPAICWSAGLAHLFVPVRQAAVRFSASTARPFAVSRAGTRCPSRPGLVG